MKRTSALKKAAVLVLAVCLLMSSPLMMIRSFAGNPQFDGSYQENANWVNATYDLVNTKYNNGEAFIIFFYRPDSCMNSSYIGTRCIEQWMNCGTKIYGLNCDKLKSTPTPNWLYNALYGTNGSISLPVVLFVRNKNVETIGAAAYLSGMSAMVSALNQKYTAFTGNVIDPGAWSTTTLSFSVTYHQTEARALIDSINSLRSDSNAWYWSVDDQSIINLKGLNRLNYDYDLERAAMQRAAELVVYYAHTRPNGESAFTAFSNYTHAGENIAYGQTTAAQVQSAWEEASEKYEGQGHRRNMLSSVFTAVGIACAEYNGVKFWVQEFRNSVISDAKTTAADSQKTVSVKVLDKYIASKTLTPSFSSLSLNVGGSAALPSVSLQTRLSVKPYNMFSAAQSCTWSSGSTAVATVSSGKVRAVGSGSTELTGTCSAGTVRIPVSVSADAYTVTYNANGGTVTPSSATISAGSAVTLPTPSKSLTVTYNANGGAGAPAPQTASLPCKGWGESASATAVVGACGAPYTPRADQTLYAVWNAAAVTLSTATPTRNNYKFKEWNTRSDGKGAAYAPGGTFNGKTNITLYAIWEDARVFTVNYNANGGTVTPASATINAGGAVTLPTPTRSVTITYKDYYGSGGPDKQTANLPCIGWGESAGATAVVGTCGASYTPKDDKTLFAIWNAATVRLTTDKPTRANYILKEWNTKADGSGTGYAPGGTYTGKANLTLYAIWEIDPTPIYYTLNYNANGGTVTPASVTVTAGSAVTLPTPTKTVTITYKDYEGSGGPDKQTANLPCMGWGESAGATAVVGACGDAYTPKNNKTLFAIWNVATVRLTSDKPIRDGYILKEWNTKADGSGTAYAPGGTFTGKTNITLYAIWEDVRVFTVNYNANGGTVAPTSATINAGGAVTLPTPTRFLTITYKANGGNGAPAAQTANLPCIGWGESAGATAVVGTCGASYTPKADKTLFAIWNPASVKLSSTTPTRSGYKFKEWNTAPDGSGTAYPAGGTYTGKINLALYAMWEEARELTVNYNPNGGTVTPTSATVYEGASVTLPTPARSLTVTYKANGGAGVPAVQTANLPCKGWGESAGATAVVGACGASYTPKADKTLFAIWNPASVKLSSTTPTRSGYIFKEWNTKADGSGTAYPAGGTYTGKINLTLYAVWAPKPTTYTLTYNANGGVGAPAAQTGSGSITLSNVKPTRSGYSFLGWATTAGATAVQYQPGARFSLTADVTLYAVWQKNPTPTIAIRNYVKERTIDYRSTITFTAITENMTANQRVVWIYQTTDSDKPVFVTGDTLTIRNATASFAVMAAITDDTGREPRGEDGTYAQTEIERVSVNTGFFAKLIAFFRGIFGSLPVITQSVRKAL